MPIKRYGIDGIKGSGGAPMPFAKAVEAGGWLYVSGQVPRIDGENVTGSITVQAHAAIKNLIAILEEAGYTVDDVVKCNAWLDDPRDFAEFNRVYRSYFGANPPARSCVQSSMMIDCKVEIDCVAYRDPS